MSLFRHSSDVPRCIVEATSETLKTVLPDMSLKLGAPAFGRFAVPLWTESGDRASTYEPKFSST